MDKSVVGHKTVLFLLNPVLNAITLLKDIRDGV